LSTGAPPIATTVGADLYAALEPLAYADASLGWPLANYVSAIGLILEDAAVLVRTDDAGNDGWSAFADPDRCPDDYLYTLAQWAGVRYPRRMSLTDLRDLIGPHAPGVWRGTKAAILASVRRWLEPGGLLYFEERADGDAYKLRIFTYTFDTLNQEAIEVELLNVVPAGLIVNYEVREGPTWAQLKASDGTWGAVNANYATWRDVAVSPLG
jgi:hypothetical protein